MKNTSEERILTDSIRIMEGTFGEGDSLFKIMKAHNISPGTILEIARTSKKVFDPKDIKLGTLYRIAEDSKTDRVEFFEYDVDCENTVKVRRNHRDGSFYAKRVEMPLETRIGVLNASINSSLYETVIEQGERPELAFELADIFAWEIDFLVDLWESDRIITVFEKKYKKGAFVQYGKVLSAEIINRGKKFIAIYFRDGSGYEDYYDEHGESLRRKFLKSPLRYKRISSYFSKKRYHPILKIYRPHLGIDYAAPVGTPVSTVGDGKVIWAGRKGQNGKLIKIKHAGGFVTTYGHLSRYARGIRRGARVKQGDLIGYVGSTGLSTGPHLDFRMRKNGRYVDPLKLKLPKSRSVMKRYRRVFSRTKRRMVVLLEEMERVDGSLVALRDDGKEKAQN